MTSLNEPVKNRWKEKEGGTLLVDIWKLAKMGKGSMSAHESLNGLE